MPSSLILARTCLTRSLRPGALTWASRSVMGFSLLRGLVGLSRRPAPCGASIPPRPANFRPIPLPRSRPSAPGKRAVRRRVQPARGEAREAEGLQELSTRADDVVGHQLADPDHLIAVIGVGNDVDVLAEPVEHGEAVGGEAADAARRLLLVAGDLPFEAFLAEGERRAPHMREVVADDEVGRFR